MRTIAIVNQKGGCGKTTTAINLGAIYARRGLRTLIIDMDPQSHCAAGLGVPERRLEYSIGEAMLADLPDGLDASSLVWEVARNLHLAPSTMRLAALEAPGGGLHELPDRDRRLERVLDVVRASYDRCLIDCPPNIGLLTFNALRAARETLIPVETGYFALKGAEKQWETVQRVIKHIGRPIACHILPTLHDPASELARDILAALRRRFAGQIVPLVIREHAALREAASLGQAVIEFAPDSEARSDYDALADWLAEHEARPLVGIEIEGTPGAAAPRERSGLEPATIVPRTTAGMDDAGPDGSRAGELAARLRELRIGKAAGIETAGAAPAPDDAAARLALLRAMATTAAAPEAPSTVAVVEDEAPAAVANGPVPAESDVSHPVREPRRGITFLYGVRTTSRGMLFVQPLAGGQPVAVAGDFTGWRPVALRPNEELGVCEALLPVPPGRHRYRLVVDGRWQADPYNDDNERNGYGELNSIVVVPVPVTEAAAR